MLVLKTGLAAILMLAASAHAGTVMESLNKELTGNRAESITTVYAQAGQMRLEPGTRDGLLIFKNDTLYSIDDQDKSYFVMDRATLKTMLDQINPMLKQLQEQLAKLPPEQRAQMEQMLGNKIPGMDQPGAQEGRQKITKTARTDKISGYSCSYVEVTAEGVIENELCVVAPAALKGGDELMSAALQMSALMQDMLEGIDAPWLKQVVDRQIENYGKIGGVPVLSRYYADGQAVNETTIKSIRTATLPASTFEVPAGYSRKAMALQK